MREISLHDAIEGVKGLFKVFPYSDHEDGLSFYSNKDNNEECTFYFDKHEYTRDEVVERLSVYFNDKFIVNGQCRIDRVTILWTTVHLEKNF